MALTDSLSTSGISFGLLRDEKRFYIDKTDMVARLARQTGPFFLSRPRRFGKSLLLTTFKELFEHGKDRFAGLKLEQDAPWDDKTYTVLHLDLSLAKGNCPGLSFELDFASLIASVFKSAGMPWGSSEIWLFNLEDILEQCESGSLVLLIDEYDAPLRDHLDDPKELKRRVLLIDDFLCAVKRHMGKFRFVFITGVVKMFGLGIGSGFNILRDISLDPRCGTIAGFTQQELAACAGPYIDHAARELKKARPQEDWDAAAVLKGLERHYGGYSFGEPGQSRVCSPRAVLNFLKAPQRGFRPYWLESGSPAALIASYIRKTARCGRGLGRLPDFFGDDFKADCSKRGLFPDFDDLYFDLSGEHFPLLPLLYQTGYLTIKSAGGEDIELGFPNGEVRRGFNAQILHMAEGRPGIRRWLRDDYLPLVRDALERGDLLKLQDLFNRYIGKLNYSILCLMDAHVLCDALYLSLLKFDGTAESKQDPACLAIENDRHRYVITLWSGKDRDEADEALQQAKEQIKTCTVA